MRYFILTAAIAFFGLAASQAQTTSPQQWQADFNILKQELPARSPELFSKYSTGAFEKDLNTLAEHLTGLSDFQTALQLQAILSKCAESQTRLDLKPLMLRETPIPFGMGWYADGLFVSGTVAKFEQAVGKKVLKINGLNTKDALTKMARFSPVENEIGLHYDVLNWFRFPTALKLAGVSQTDTLELLLENETGQQEAMRLHPLDMTKRNDMMPAQIQQDKRDIRWKPAHGYFTLQYLEPDSVFYVQYNRCVSMEMALAEGADSTSAQRFPPFTPFADSVVHFMQLHPRTKLFIDLRFNPGGDPADGIKLIDRLAALQATNRKDRMFVATNLYTGGAAIDIAVQFRNRSKATLIGDSPAGKPNRFMEPHSFTLPNSKIEVSYGTKQQQTVKGNPDVLKPDVLLELPFGDFKAGRDPVLDYVRKIKM
jgi:hypothetical protein